MSAAAIADICGYRESCYMFDFIPDSSGLKVREIHLDLIGDSDQPESDSPFCQRKIRKMKEQTGLR